MALVMLPCDLPWWENVKNHLIRISSMNNCEELTDEMERIFELCNISLDPDDDSMEPDLFSKLRIFLDQDLTKEERDYFFHITLPNIAKKAIKLKELKPKGGLYFSLQQQPDQKEYEYEFIASLIANAFFSTFPRRTDKSHPTLRNFNFSNFFQSLDLPCQKSKLKSVLHYFNWLEKKENCIGKLRVMRQVMSGREWLTIEDWLECSLPLCPIQIKHEGKLERAEANSLKICFSKSKIGESVLTDGISQESINLCTFPELLSTLLNVEALEDNEVLTIENVRHITRINDPKNKATLETLEYPYMTSICCMDPDNYTKLPISQYEEDNVLRELNKCLLAFQQRHNNFTKNNNDLQNHHKHIPTITQDSCSTRSNSFTNVEANNNTNRLQVRKNLNMELVNNRRGAFIVLGSSGECLPVNRRPLETMKTIYSSCTSSEEEFHSARTSLENDDQESEEENCGRKYSIDLETSERRKIFAKQLKVALKYEASMSTESSSSDSFAVGISITGAEVEDRNFSVKRECSTGFALREDSLDEEFLNDSLNQEKKWIDNFKNKHSPINKQDSGRISDNSCSSEYSSEKEELYEQLSRWLEDPIIETEKGAKRELDSRELAVVKFAGTLLKRTLSESFAGIPVPLTEDFISTAIHEKKSSNRNKLVFNAKSLSLELERHRHRLAAQLISQIAGDSKSGLQTIATGNWGCGSSKKGDVQIKVIIQWLAASVAGVPSMIYYTCGHQQMAKLDTVCRILVDRKWCVKDLAQAMLKYSNQILHGREISGNLFQELIGYEKQ